MGGISNAQLIDIRSDGLSLFPMGSTLQSELMSDLRDIDTSTIHGHLEYRMVSIDYHDNDDGPYIYKKLVDEKYTIAGMDVENIYIGHTESGKVRQAAIKLRNYDFSKVKNFLDSIYGSPEVAAYSEINGNHHQTYLWSSSGFDITFSGLMGIIDFFYPPPAYSDRYLKGLN